MSFQQRMNYIDIHTHKACAAPKGEIRIKNLFPSEAIPEKPLFFSCGLHPWFVDGHFYANEANLRMKLQDERCLALGETGLDKLKPNDFILQMDAFRWQLELASEFGLPIIVHCVKAWNDLLKVRREFDDQIWIIHAFNASRQIAEELLLSGCYLSFGSLLFRHSKAAKIFGGIPPERIFLETDDVAMDIKQVYEKASELLKYPQSELQNIISANFARVFRK